MPRASMTRRLTFTDAMVEIDRLLSIAEETANDELRHGNMDRYHTALAFRDGVQAARDHLADLMAKST